MFRCIIKKKKKSKKKSEDMIKTETRKTWSDRVNFTLRNRFSRTFKVLKPMSWTPARGVAPGPHQARCPMNFHLLIKFQ